MNIGMNDTIGTGRLEPDQVLAPAPLEHHHQHAVGGADASRLSSAALSGTRIDRNTTISSRNDNSTTAAMNHGQPVGDPVGDVAEVGGLTRRRGPWPGCRRAPAGNTSARRRSTVVERRGVLRRRRRARRRSWRRPPPGRPRRGDRGDTAGRPRSLRSSGSTTVASSAMSTATTQRAVDAGTEAVGDEVVGPTLGAARRQRALVGEAELQIEHRRREREQEHGRADRVRPRRGATRAGPSAAQPGTGRAAATVPRRWMPKRLIRDRPARATPAAA